jgi:hypothetical protein
LRQLDTDADVIGIVIVDRERARLFVDVHAERLREAREHIETVVRRRIALTTLSPGPRARHIFRQSRNIDHGRVTQSNLARLLIATGRSVIVARHTHTQVRQRQTDHREEVGRNRSDHASLDARHSRLVTDRSNHDRVRVADRLQPKLRRHQQLPGTEQVIFGSKRLALRYLEANSIDVFRHREIAFDNDGKPTIFLVVTAANRCNGRDRRQRKHASRTLARSA